MAKTDRDGDTNATLRLGDPDHRRLFHSVPARFLGLAPDLTIVEASDAYLRATMTEREAVIGRALFEVFPDSPDEPEASGVRNLRASLEQVLESRTSDAMAVQRYPIRRPDSEGGGFEERHWSPSNHPVLGDDGEVAWIIHQVEDVTELVRLEQQGIDRAELDHDLRVRAERMEAEVILRSLEIQETNRKLREANRQLGELHGRLEREAAEREEALRTSDERYRLLIEGVRDYAIFMLGAGGKIVSWSPAAQRIKGYAEEEILGKDYTTFFLADDVAAEVPARLIQRAAELGSVTIEDWRVRKDGSRFWASDTLTALYDDDQKVRGFAMVSRDLTEQRRSEVVLQSIVNTAIDGIITIDSNGRVQTFNRAAESIFGYEAVEVVGNNISMLMPEPYHSQHDDFVGAYLRTGVAKIIGIGREVRGRRKDGTTFPLELAVSQFSLDGSPCFTGLVRDISARKRMETQLQQAQKMEAVGQLAAGVAHDFNNLLTVIAGYSELAYLTLPPEDKVRAMIGEVRRAAERATSLTGQLLAYSRQQVLEPKVFNLNSVLRETERMLRRLIGEDIALETRLDDELVAVRADPGQVDQIVMNMVVNARDAMPQGGKLLIETSNVVVDEEFASAHPGLTPGDFVLLAITDTGCGMSADVRERVFEPFFTTKGVGRGSGLGLSVIDGIVRQTGGHVDVYSEVGVGSVFKVYLPVAGDAQPGKAAAAVVDGVGGSETILLVEDDAGVRSLAMFTLRHCGYDVLEAVDGADALDVLNSRDGDVDLLLTDVVMPGISGRKVAEAAKASYPAIKVLYMSGYTDDSVVRHGVLQAEIAFLQKPFTPGSLVRKVREVLDSD